MKKGFCVVGVISQHYVGGTIWVYLPNFPAGGLFRNLAQINPNGTTNMLLVVLIAPVNGKGAT